MRSGFVTLIGRTNAGKSSLLNYLLNQKISMVSHKQNATRRKILGIVMHGDDQAIFIDTPGLHDSSKALNKFMIQSAISSLGDADVAVFVASVFDGVENYEKFLNLNSPLPHIIALTKIDEITQDKLFKKLNEYQKYSNNFQAIIPITIKKQAYRKIFLDALMPLLPTHPHYYDPEYITTTNEKDIYKDFILEAIFECVSQEIPYSSDAMVSKVKQNGDILEIQAKIITDNNHHKAILIGKNGATIKRIGIVSRKIISKFNNQKVCMKLSVEVDKNWHTNENSIKKYLDIKGN
ncbi:GTPase Era [Campylobacter porcelli]|uniref:GTPase Era n=1 Tax=Campylobacter porcelli TaxID=1660073 RepID=A0A1X9SWM4_9BACT|nr:GTPase Era [Campylobacter sp. RM6137]ARR00660.1 GTP-binding protein [Campylobacter sp. RM6137]